MLTIDEKRKDRFVSIVNYHMESDFEPLSDYTISYMGYPLVGYPVHKDAVPGPIPKAVDFDFDHTLTAEDSPNGFISYLKHLSHFNSEIDKEYSNIIRIVGEFAPGNLYEPAEKITKKFRHCDVTLEQHTESCYEGSKDIKMVNGYLPMFYKLESMLYTSGIKSGSPDELVKIVALEKIGFDEAAVDLYVKGSPFVFVDGKFVSLFPLLYENKREKSDIFVKKVTGLANGLHIAVGDEIGDAYMVRSVVNPFFYIGAPAEKGMQKEVPSEMWIALPQARNDPKKIIKPLKRYERALAFFFGFDEPQQQKIMESAFNVNKSFSVILRPSPEIPDFQTNIQKSKEDLLRAVNIYLDSISALASRFSTKIDKTIEAVERAKDDEIIIKATEELWSKMKFYYPEMSLNEKIL